MSRPSAPDRRLRKTERREQILLELRLKPHVRIAELAEQFGVSSETVRKDVEALSQAGQLQRAYGGASPSYPGARRDLDERRRERIEERERLARHAASLVRDGDTLMIDAGATTIQFARFVAYAGARVTAITNCLQVAMTLGQSREASVMMAPGRYMPEEAALVGAETIEFLERYRVDQCFLGASGISEAGVTESVEGFDAIKRVMLRQSRWRNFLIDAGKFGQTHFAWAAGFDDFDLLVTDRAPDGALARRLGEGRARASTPDEAGEESRSAPAKSGKAPTGKLSA